MKRKPTAQTNPSPLRRRAEERVKAREQSPKSEVDRQRLLQELQVHQVELERQNEAPRQTQGELATALERQAEFYDFAPAGFFTLDARGSILQVNLPGARLLGIERSRLPRRRFGLFVAESDRRAFSAFLANVLGGQAKAACEVALTPASGQPPLLVQIKGLRSHAGQECRVVVLDITERKRMERELVESLALQAVIVDSTSDLIWSVDHERFGLLTFNRALRDYFLDARRLTIQIGYRPEDLLPADHVQRWHDMYQRALREGSYTMDYVVHTQTRRLELSFNLLRREGTVFGISVFGKDITERKLAQEKLQATEASAQARADELATVLAATPALTFIAHDPECRRMTSSGAALRLLRLPDGANTSKSAPPGERPGTFRVLKDGRELRAEELPVQRAAATGQPVENAELTLVFADGTARDIAGGAVPLFDAQGQVRGAVGAFLDITERKRAEEAVRQLSARRVQVQEEERRRVARELHDTLGQNLALLCIDLSLLQQQAAPKLPAPAKGLLTESLALAEQCTRECRTSSYLLYPPTLDELGLASAMRDHVDSFARRSGLRVDLELPPKLVRLPRATELALFRVLQESLSNLRRHSGSPTASITLTQSADQIRLEVRDQGRGMRSARPPAAQPPPSPAGSTDPPAPHPGLGIPGMRERMRQLGGTLEIQSNDQGTTVRAIVPRKPEPAEPERAAGILPAEPGPPPRPGGRP